MSRIQMQPLGACTTAPRRADSPLSARIFVGIGCLTISLEQTSWVANPKRPRHRQRWRYFCRGGDFAAGREISSVGDDRWLDVRAA
jgi:hypothetical protein